MKHVKLITLIHYDYPFENLINEWHSEILKVLPRKLSASAQGLIVSMATASAPLICVNNFHFKYVFIHVFLMLLLIHCDFYLNISY